MLMDFVSCNAPCALNKRVHRKGLANSLSLSSFGECFSQLELFTLTKQRAPKIIFKCKTPSHKSWCFSLLILPLKTVFSFHKHVHGNFSSTHKLNYNNTNYYNNYIYIYYQVNYNFFS